MSSSSLSEPPEELLSDAAGGMLLFAIVAVSVGESPEVYENDVEPLFLQVSADLTLTARTVVLFGLLVCVAVAQVHGRTAPGPGLCTGTRGRGMIL